MNDLEKLIEKAEYIVIGKKTTVCLITLRKTGFEIVGTSACVNIDDFNKKIGEEWAYKDALRKLDEFNGLILSMKAETL